jgi:hypothetical protein
MAKAQPILPSKVQRAEYGRSVYSATLEDGVSAADVTKSDFWIHLAPQLEAMDHIEAITPDGETYLELLVSRVERISDGNRTVRIPKVVVLHNLKLGAESAAARKTAEAAADAPAPSLPAEDESVRNQQTNFTRTGETPAGEGESFSDADGDGVPDGYKVTYGGPTHKWRVIKDGVTDPLASGMSKKDAIAWAGDHASKSA